MEKEIIIRIKYNSLVRIKKIFRPIRYESVASYFRRLAKWLEVTNGKTGRYKRIEGEK